MGWGYVMLKPHILADMHSNSTHENRSHCLEKDKGLQESFFDADSVAFFPYRACCCLVNHMCTDYDARVQTFATVVFFCQSIGIRKISFLAGLFRLLPHMRDEYPLALDL
ncbi:hypothetical protein TNCV_2262731 [Trichonephila clavipes]|nr:hypothetical protein TNCV_2262731 [Trichonephila clavipes]